MSRSYLITTTIRGHSQTQVWDAAEPLALGSPMRWVLERSERGVRIRDLPGRLNQMASAVYEFDSERLNDQGAVLELPHASLRIRRARTSPEPFGSRAGTGALSCYFCIDRFILSAERLANENGSVHRARIGKAGGEIFEIARAAEKWTLTSRSAEPIALSLQGKARILSTGESLEIPSYEALVDLNVRFGSYVWRFGASNQAEALAEKPKAPAATDPEFRRFIRSLQISAAFLAGFVALSWLWPKPDPRNEELIPPQFTKIVMNTKTMNPSSGASGGGAPKADRVAVAQALRANALQSSIRGLLRGGMTRLLAESNIVAGNVRDAQTRRALGRISNALAPTALRTGFDPSLSAKVAAIGGAAGAGGSGSGSVGYGTGEKAEVRGQGQGFVSMDLGNSSVEEGLTKDEVGEVIHRHLDEVRYCYESAMIRRQDVEGKLQIQFSIGGNGSVKSADVQSSTLSDPKLDDCVLRRLMTWKFPQPKGGVTVAVAYPFIFKTLGR